MQKNMSDGPVHGGHSLIIYSEIPRYVSITLRELSSDLLKLYSEASTR